MNRYALDRDIESPFASTSSPANPSPLVPSNQHHHHRPFLLHRDNSQDRLTEPLLHATARQRPSISSTPWSAMRRHRSQSTGSHASSSGLSDAAKDRPMAVGLAEQMPFPKHASDYVEGDEMHAVSERRRLRQVYEAEGWLPGPRPGRDRRLKRRKALYVRHPCPCPCYRSEPKQMLELTLQPPTGPGDQRAGSAQGGHDQVCRHGPTPVRHGRSLCGHPLRGRRDHLFRRGASPHSSCPPCQADSRRKAQSQ